MTVFINTMSILSLPTSLLTNIISTLSLKEYFSVILTCKKLNRLTNNESLLRLLCDAQFKLYFADRYNKLEFVSHANYHRKIRTHFAINNPAWPDQYASLRIDRLFETIYIDERHHVSWHDIARSMYKNYYGNAVGLEFTHKQLITGNYNIFHDIDDFVIALIEHPFNYRPISGTYRSYAYTIHIGKYNRKGNGFITIISSDSRLYNGYMMHNQPYGNGYFMNADRTIYDGIWHNGIQRSCRWHSLG